MTPPSTRATRWADGENAARRTAYEQAAAAWQTHGRALDDLVATAGAKPSAPKPAGFSLKRGERVVHVVPATLVDCLRPPTGGYTGFSYVVTAGLRYGTPSAEDVRPRDTGTAVVTTRRVVFRGALASHEWTFADLVGYTHATHAPYTALHVSGRPGVSGLCYDPSQAATTHFAIALAVAHQQGTVPAFVAALEAERVAHRAGQPVPPEPVTPGSRAPNGLLSALRTAYIGRPDHSPLRRVVQGAFTFTITAALAGAALSPSTDKTSSSRPVAEAAPTTPPAATVPSPAKAAAPVATRAATTAPPRVVSTTVAPRPAPPAPKPKPTPKPRPKPVAASTCGAPANPWGYNFCGRGGYIGSPPASFCTYFGCIPSFWESTNGYVMQCDDGMFSHSGGRSGSCSHHGGNNRALLG